MVKKGIIFLTISQNYIALMTRRSVMETIHQTTERVEIDTMEIIAQILSKVHNLLELYLQNHENPEKYYLWYQNFAETEWGNVQKIIMILFDKKYFVPPKPLGEHIQQILVIILKLTSKKLFGWSHNLIDYLNKIALSDLLDLMKQLIVFLFTDEKLSNKFSAHTSEMVLSSTTKKKYLTPREQQCLDLYLRGLSAKETAKTLDVSYRTVEYYLARIKKKFNCKNLREIFYNFPTVDFKDM